MIFYPKVTIKNEFQFNFIFKIMVQFSHYGADNIFFYTYHKSRNDESKA